MSEHRVAVDNGKYTFILRGGCHLDVDRYDKPWVHDLDAVNAIHSMMAELDAARVVLEAARRLEGVTGEALFDARIQLSAAIVLHDNLVSDRTPPSIWAKPK